MPQIITANTDEPHLVQSTPLDGQGYEFEFIWRERTGRWYWTLRLDSGETIIEGRPLLPSTTPLRGHGFDFGPPGIFVVLGPSNPDRHDFGDDLKLVYFAEDEFREPTDDAELTVK